jgi:hypothetical protein
MEAIPFILFVLVWIFLYKYLVNKKQKGKIVSHLLSFITATIVMFLSIIPLAPELTPEQKAQIAEETKQEQLKEQELEKIKKEKELAKKKQEELITLQEDTSITLDEAKRLQLYELEKLSKRYVQSKNLDESYNKKFYDCLGNLIWEKNGTFTVGEMLDWCYDDYKLSKDHQMKEYYNTAWLLSDFSVWDGSYTPLENLLKANMLNEDSYDHVQTRYSLVYYGKNLKRPYMQITMTYKGTNAFNAIVKNTILAKVDAKTKEIFDIKQ